MKTTPTIHRYQGDRVFDYNDDDRCVLPCGLPRSHPVHLVPDVSDAVRVEQARRMGEAE